MGGYGSGRSGGGPTVESGRRLDLYQLIRDGMIQPGTVCSGTLQWTESPSRKRVPWMLYEARLEDRCGTLRVRYTTAFGNGTKHESNYLIDLVTTAQPLGGLRWWFLCPSKRTRASKLYLPPGAHTFACRQTYRLAYRSQRESPLDRSISRAFKLREQLGSDGGIGDYISKPKGMRWHTFEKRMDRLTKAEAVVEGYEAQLAAMPEKKTGR